MTRAARIAWFATAPLICLAVFWRAPLNWFQNDDFAWLGLPLEVNRPADLLHVLFSPEAQGTVRVLSERVFFLTFSWIFGLHALPYHLWALTTWCGDLTLAALIGARLTGSRAAGLLAAVLWTTSPNLTAPLCWASSYNELLCAFCVLLAFYARLRWIESGRGMWMAIEWAAYLAGFGALEIIVMYPALASLHALCFARKKLLSALPLFVPAVIFTGVHFFFIPKNPGAYYALAVDGRLPGTLFEYLKWALGPSQLGDWVRHGRRFGLITTALTGVALLAFALWRWKQRELFGVFCVGWLLLLLAPVLPLPNHMIDYYLTVPEVGLAWLGGWALVRAWNAGARGRAVALVLVAAYLGGSILEIQRYSRWYQERSEHIRTVVLGLRDAQQAHPGRAFLLQGVDNELFQSGFQDDPFRLIDIQKVYFAPGSEQGIQAREDLGGMKRWVISPSIALMTIERGQAAVFQVANDRMRDITPLYQAVLRADPRATRRDLVDVGDPFYAGQLGSTWYTAENGFRWMPRTATVTLSGPESASAKLYVTGYAPAAVVAPGPLTLQFRASGRELGSRILRSEEQFTFEFPLPPELVGQRDIEIAIEASHVVHTAADARDFGVVFGTFSIK
jgi:hypothetical protein